MSTSMFRSLSIFNYRVWFIGALVSNVGAWMQSTAQNWVVLTQLTDNDAAAMGVTMALQFAPPLLLVSVTGWVADRFDRRKLIMCTQSALLLLAVTLGVLLLSGAMTLPLMFGFALALGVVTAFDNPARQAFVSDLVSQENASNAVALNAASFNMARRGGPARLADGFRYVARRPDLVVIFVMVFLLGAFGMNFPIFASTMALEFGRGADGFGLLSSFVAIGSLAGALLAARRERARMRVVIVGSGGFAVASALSVFAPSYGAYAATLVLTGFCVVTTLTTANGYVQTTTDPVLRGRVLALYMAILLGGTPVGAPIVGAVAAEFGPRVAIALAAVVAVIACGIGATWTAMSGRLHRHETKRFRLTLDETRPITTIAPEPEDFSDEIAGTTPIPLPPGERSPRATPRPRHGD